MSIRAPIFAPVAWAGAVGFAASLAWFAYCYAVRWGNPAASGSVGAVLFDVALFSAFALHHSLFARAAVKDRIRRVVPPALERSTYTWVVSLLFVLVCWWWQPVSGVWYRLDGIWAVAGYSVQIAGVLLTLRGAGAIDFLDLAGVRAVQQDASGAAPEHLPLQTRGMYRFVRHPLYFAWTLMVFGTPVMTATRATFAIVSTAYLVLAIHWEERALVELFGPAYIAYRQQVRWRMLPGIY
jgi:protein-S-isoprenylcysteine O-methyltransferase Ste14